MQETDACTPTLNRQGKINSSVKNYIDYSDFGIDRLKLPSLTFLFLKKKNYFDIKMPTTNTELSGRSEVRHEDFGVTDLTGDMAATQNLRLVSHFLKN